MSFTVCDVLICADHILKFNAKTMESSEKTTAAAAIQSNSTNTNIAMLAEIFAIHTFYGM